MNKTLKKTLGAIATMAGTQALLFWLGAIDQPLWLIGSMVLFSAGIWCFADDDEKEEVR